MKLIKLIAVGLISLSISQAYADTSLKKIIENLDISSFRNSLGPRSPEKGATLPSFGFNIPINYDNKEIYGLTDKNNSWSYSIKIIKEEKNNITICFYDYANTTQSTYKAAEALKLKKDINGKYASISENITNISCN